jgi:hypothetical protein
LISYRSLLTEFVAVAQETPEQMRPMAAAIPALGVSGRLSGSIGG